MRNNNRSLIVLGANRVKKLASPVSTLTDESLVLDGSCSPIYWYGLAFIKAILFSWNTDCRAIIGMGTRLVGACSLVVGRVTGTPVIIRIGGDLWSTHESKLKHFRECGNYVLYLKYLLIQKSDRIILNRCDGVIVVSERLKSKVEANTSIKSKHIKIVRPPIDISRFASEDYRQNEPEYRVERINLITVTNLNFKDKLEGVKDCIETIAPLLESEPEVELQIAGGGEYLDELKKFVDRDYAGIAPQISILGFVDPIERFYWRGDVFVYVSYEDSCPNVVLEAGAAGLPRVVGGVPDLKEQIDDGTDGFVVSPHDELTFRAAVTTLLDDEEMRQVMGRCAADKVNVEYNPSAIAEDLDASISELTGK